MEVLTEAPQTSFFVPLSEHQSATPESFYNGPSVLYYYSDRCKMIVLEDELQNAPAIQGLVSKASTPAYSNEPKEEHEETNGTHQAQKTLEDIDIWVTSDKLLLFSVPHSIGVSIPYPTISLHAIQSLPTPSSTEPQSQGLYMQLIPSIPASGDDDEPPDTVSVTIIPNASAPPPSTAPTANTDNGIESVDNPERTPVLALFTALSDCSNLHPDPDEEGDGDDGQGVSRLMQAGLAIPGSTDGSLPPPMPGSGGWITAENMHEFIDEDGNFIQDNNMDSAEGEVEGGISDLGPGAGTVRPRPDYEKEGDGIGDDAKWQRTS